jgi:hypothetical protein
MSRIHTGVDYADLDAQPGVSLAADLVPGVGNLFERQRVVQGAIEHAYWMYSYYAWDGSESSCAFRGNPHDHEVCHCSGFTDHLSAIRFKRGPHLEMLLFQNGYTGAKLSVGCVRAMTEPDGLGGGGFASQLDEVAIGHGGRYGTNTDKKNG